MYHNICRVEECNQYIFAKKLCAKHYYRVKKYGDTHKRIRVSYKKHIVKIKVKGSIRVKPCTIPYCENPLIANGLCNKHYIRKRETGSATYMRIHPRYYKRWCLIHVNRQCKADGCRKKIDSLGLCLMHYTRQRNNGHYSIVKKVVGENRTKHPLYKAFHAMHARCNNPNHKYYDYYGGRGIKVCERWSGLNGFPNFLKDMGDKPEGYTIDRINNSAGYSPENCRWASKKQQILNTRLPTTNKSGYKGVFQYGNGKWVASIYIKGKKKHLGYYTEQKDAVEARKKAELQLSNPKG